MKTKNNSGWILDIISGVLFIIAAALQIFRLKNFVSGTLFITCGIIQFHVARIKLGK